MMAANKTRQRPHALWLRAHSRAAYRERSFQAVLGPEIWKIFAREILVALAVRIRKQAARLALRLVHQVIGRLTYLGIGVSVGVYRGERSFDLLALCDCFQRRVNMI